MLCIAKTSFSAAKFRFLQYYNNYKFMTRIYFGGGGLVFSFLHFRPFLFFNFMPP